MMKIKKQYEYITIKDMVDDVEHTFNINDRVGISNFCMYADEPKEVQHFTKIVEYSLVEYIMYKLKK